MLVNLPRIVTSLVVSAGLMLTVASCGYKGGLTQPPPPVADAQSTTPPAAPNPSNHD